MLSLTIRLCLGLCGWVWMAPLAEAGMSQRTADYLRLEGGTLGQRVTLDVACIKPLGNVIEPAPGIALVFAQTWDENEEHAGGEIAVLLRREALDDAFQRYGARFDLAGARMKTARLSGILGQSADGILCVDATGGVADVGALTLRSRGTLREILGRRPGLRR